MPRIWLLSDLHLDVFPWKPPTIPDADVAVVAGDVGGSLAESVSWIAETIRPHMPAVLVAGNHEFYGGVHDEELAQGRRAAAAQDVHLLENDTVEIAGIVFSGCTLWTDYGVQGPERRFANREAARVCMRDHRRIAWRRTPGWLPFRPEEAEALNAEALTFLDQALSDYPASSSRPHVVVTHHAPSARSIAPRFAGSALNGAFVNDLDAFVLRTGPTAWLHGHVHNSFDYRIGHSRILCNPRGYGSENREFAPSLVFDIGS